MVQLVWLLGNFVTAPMGSITPSPNQIMTVGGRFFGIITNPKNKKIKQKIPQILPTTTNKPTNQTHKSQIKTIDPKNKTHKSQIKPINPKNQTHRLNN